MLSMSDFLKGVFYLIRALPLIFTTGLKRFIVLPIIFNITLFSISVYLIYHSSWLRDRSGILQVIILLILFVVFVSMFTILFTMVAAPFNGVLAEKTQKILCHSSIPSIPISQIIFRSIKRQGQFIAYFFPRFIFMVLLFFVPLIHAIYPFLWFWFASWILGLQYLDVVTDNNGKTFPEMRAIMKERPMLFLGFGFMINGFSFIPLFNLILLPAAVIGAVLMYNKEYHKKQEKKILLMKVLTQDRPNYQ